MKQRITILSIFLAVLMLLSIGNTPVVSQTPPPPAHGFGELSRFYLEGFNTYTSDFSSDASNETHLLHVMDSSSYQTQNYYGAVEIFSIGPEYNQLVEQYAFENMSDSGPMLDQVPYDMTYAQIMFESTMQETYSDSVYEWDIMDGVLQNYSFADSSMPYTFKDRNINALYYNNTYNIIFDEMIFPTGMSTEQVWIDFIQTNASVDLYLERSLFSDNRYYNITGASGMYSINGVNVSMTAYLNNTYNVTLYLGDETDPNTPIFSTTVDIVFDFSFNTVYYYDLGGRLMEWEEFSSNSITSNINDTQSVMFMDPFGNFTYSNITVSMWGSDFSQSYQSGTIVDWLPPIVSFGTSPYTEGDVFVYDATQYRYANGGAIISTANDTFWSDSEYNATLSGQQYIEVVRTNDFGFEAISYGMMEGMASFYASSSYDLGYSETFYVIDKNFDIFGRNSDDPNKELEDRNFGRYKVDMGDDIRLDLQEMSRSSYFDVLSNITINGFEYTNLEVEVTMIEYGLYLNESFIGPPGPMLDQFSEEGFALTQASAFVTYIYDPATTALLMKTDLIDVSLSFSLNQYENGTWVYSENRYFEGTVEMSFVLAEHPIYYQSPQATNSTSDVISNSTSTTGNTTDTVPSNSSTTSTTEPVNSTSTTSGEAGANETEVPTLDNPLPGFELAVASSAVFTVIFFRRRKK